MQNEVTMLLTVGVLAVIFGLLSIFWGDREIGSKGGMVLRLFSWRKGQAKWMKILIGVALIIAGVLTIARALNPPSDQPGSRHAHVAGWITTSMLKGIRPVLLIP